MATESAQALARSIHKFPPEWFDESLGILESLVRNKNVQDEAKAKVIDAIFTLSLDSGFSETISEDGRVTKLLKEAISFSPQASHIYFAATVTLKRLNSLRQSDEEFLQELRSK